LFQNQGQDNDSNVALCFATSGLDTFNNIIAVMGLIRVILCILFPPLAVLDKGCGSVLITLLLTCCGLVPGIIAALIINNRN
jgi:uncharacterized membrane protein YqaE (UPF0057 family)